MDKLKFRRSGIQARVLALTMFFTLGASLVIAASNMHQMTAEWERTTILNAEYALQTAASAIRRRPESPVRKDGSAELLLARGDGRVSRPSPRQ